MTFVPLARSRPTPRAEIFSPVIPTSPTNAPAGVTTFPPFTIVSNFTERAIEHVEGEVDVRSGNAHGRLDAQDVSVEPALANQHSHLSRGLENGERLLFRRLLRLSVAHQLDAKHESHAANISNQRVLLHQRLEPVLHALAEDAGVFLKPVLVDDVEHGKSRSHTHRIAAEG